MRKATNPDKATTAPAVSIIIPVYGVEKYIEQCVRSLFEQTLDSIEYIFIDDCSPDNSIAVMQKVLEEYPQRKEQVKIIRHEVNQGVGAARNHGVAACTGEYVTHCDPDDWVDLDLYETMYNQAVNTNADMVHCGFELCLGSSYRKSFNISEGLSSTDIINILIFDHSWGSLGNKIFRGSIARSEKIHCPDYIFINEDVLRVVQMLLECKVISSVRSCSYFYRYNPSSASKGKFSKKKLDSINQAADLLTEILPQEKFFESLIKLKCQNLMYLIKYPEITSLREFDHYVNKSGRKTIKENLHKLSKGCRLYLGIALVNYHLACIAYKIIDPVKCIVYKLICKEKV